MLKLHSVFPCLAVGDDFCGHCDVTNRLSQVYLVIYQSPSSFLKFGNTGVPKYQSACVFLFFMDVLVAFV